MLKHAVADGRAGQAPKKRGASSGIPHALVEAVAGFAQLKQVAGDELKPRALISRAMAAVKGTPLSLPRAQGQGRERAQPQEGAAVAYLEALAPGELQ